MKTIEEQRLMAQISETAAVIREELPLVRAALARIAKALELQVLNAPRL